MLTVIETSKNIGLQKGLKIGNNSRVQLKELNADSLTRKSKKLPTKMWPIRTHELDQQTKAASY